MSKQDNGGPAFPQFEVVAGERDGHGDIIEAYTVATGGMSLRAYAAIKLRVADSGIDWLDDMIRQSQRDEFAGQALAGYLVNPNSHSGYTDNARKAYVSASAMLTERSKTERK